MSDTLRLNFQNLMLEPKLISEEAGWITEMLQKQDAQMRSFNSMLKLNTNRDFGTDQQH